jgi:hypothetical protein
MPITFADCVDPMLRVPAMQGAVAAQLLTLGLVPPAQAPLFRAAGVAASTWAAGRKQPAMRFRGLDMKAAPLGPGAPL